MTYYSFIFSVKGEELAPLAEGLLTNLFNVLEKPVSEENEYVMKGGCNV